MVEAAQVLIVICATAAFLGCSARFYLRVIIQKHFLFSEFVLLLAPVFQIGLVALQLCVFRILPTIQNPVHFIEAQKLFFCGTFVYFATLWSVKISINLLHIQLTRKFARIHFLSILMLCFLIGTWPLIYIVYLTACIPIERRWALPTSRQCIPISRAWDFWTHTTIHLGTDIILCILPFPALLKVSEPRLRLAVCGVYGLAIISIIVSVIRVILLAIDIEDSIKRIMLLSTIETTTCIVIGILPGISSTFTQKYVQTGSGFRQPDSSEKASKGKSSNQDSSGLMDSGPSQVKAGVDPDAIEPSQHYRAEAFAGEGSDSISFKGSSDETINRKGFIRKVTHISVTN